MDHDTYSANDAIGKVSISLNPLLLPTMDSNGQEIRTGKGTSFTPTLKKIMELFFSRYCYVWLDTGIRYNAWHSGRSKFNCQSGFIFGC